MQQAQTSRPSIWITQLWAKPWPFSQLAVSAAIFLYTLSLYKFGKRDPLGSDLGFQGPLEAVLIGTSFLLTLATCLMRRLRLAGWGVLFLTGYAFFALLSSSQSYWPPLSAVKALLMLLTIAMASFACSAIGPQAVLSRFYWSMFLLIGIAILTGLLIPQSFPLFQLDPSGRRRLWIFATHPGVAADFAAILFLLGLFMKPRPPIAAQLGVLSVNFACGGRSSSAVLLGFLLLIYLVHSRRSIIALLSRSFIVLVVLGICTLGGLLTIVLVEPLRIGVQSVFMRTLAESVSVNGRTPIWAFSLNMIRDSIFLGYGPEGARVIFLREFIWSSNAHSGYLEILLTAGWIGGACFFLGWWLIVMRVRRLISLGERVTMLSTHLYLAVLGIIGGLIAPQFTVGLFVLVVMAYLTGRNEVHGDQTAKIINCRPLV